MPPTPRKTFSVPEKGSYTIPIFLLTNLGIYALDPFGSLFEGVFLFGHIGLQSMDCRRNLCFSVT